MNVPLHNWTARFEEQLCLHYPNFSFPQRFLLKSDSDKSGKSASKHSLSFPLTSFHAISGDVGLAEFVDYIKQHEKNLRLQFSNLDKNKDGKVDLEEMIVAFKELGIVMERAEALRLFNR